MYKKSIILMFCLFGMVACGPMYKTVTDYHPPKDSRARQCVNSCDAMKHSCNSQCKDREHQCEMVNQGLKIIEQNSCYTKQRRCETENSRINNLNLTDQTECYKRENRCMQDLSRKERSKQRECANQQRICDKGGYCSAFSCDSDLGSSDYYCKQHCDSTFRNISNCDLNCDSAIDNSNCRNTNRQCERSCSNNYDQCFTNCGGRIEKREVCIFNCN